MAILSVRVRRLLRASREEIKNASEICPRDEHITEEKEKEEEEDKSVEDVKIKF